MQKRRFFNNASKQQGFTLIELLIAITLMAVMAGLGWRGLDVLMRSRDINQTRVDQTAVLQTVLAQWRSDLDHMTSVPSISDAGLVWDGQTMRITRHASAPMANGADAGLWVVAWTRRAGRWWRWQSPALQDRRSLNEAWVRAERWGKNASADDQNFETPIKPYKAGCPSTGSAPTSATTNHETPKPPSSWRCSAGGNAHRQLSRHASDRSCMATVANRRS